MTIDDDDDDDVDKEECYCLVQPSAGRISRWLDDLHRIVYCVVVAAAAAAVFTPTVLYGTGRSKRYR